MFRFFGLLAFGDVLPNRLVFDGLPELIENGAIKVEENLIGDFIGEEFISVKEPDFSLFSDSELKILATVKEYFKDFTAKRITDYSHDEKAYKETAPGDKISYEYASDLKL